jgi:hypothetical protein
VRQSRWGRWHTFILEGARLRFTVVTREAMILRICPVGPDMSRCGVQRHPIRDNGRKMERGERETMSRESLGNHVTSHTSILYAPCFLPLSFPPLPYQVSTEQQLRLLSYLQLRVLLGTSSIATQNFARLKYSHTTFSTLGRVWLSQCFNIFNFEFDRFICCTRWALLLYA